jgi:hypothetical protein
MCEECEEITPLTVAYLGKVEGWRPPVRPQTESIHEDWQASAQPYAISAVRFTCTLQDRLNAGQEVD